MEYIFLSLGLNYDNKIKRSLRSLSVIDNELSCFENNFAVGIYDAKYNRLFINPSINNLFGNPIFEAVFSHELFHGITTKRDIANMAIGFYHVKDNLGIGLTELSTQYFIGKFIGGRKEYYNVFDIKLMDKLLSIVGYPLFLNYIFNNDTNGLINHFANYIGISEAIRLMLLIDNYYYSARSFNESLMLTNIASAFSTDSILSEIYRKIDQKVQADICRDKYEKSIMTLIYQMQNYKKDINPIESGKII